MAIVPLKTAAKMNVWSFVSQPGPFWLEPIGPFSIMMSLDKKKRKFLRFYGTSPLWYCVPSTTIGNRCATFRVYVRAHRVGGGEVKPMSSGFCPGKIEFNIKWLGMWLPILVDRETARTALFFKNSSVWDFLSDMVKSSSTSNWDILCNGGHAHTFDFS